MTDRDESLNGLTNATGNILYRAGYTDRSKVVEAGEVSWLKLPGFGAKRLKEVEQWLGSDSPRHQREVARCRELLERDGYAILPPNA